MDIIRPNEVAGKVLNRTTQHLAGSAGGRCGTYTLVVTGANGCTSTATAEALPQECDGCDMPIIISCGPAFTTVECGTSIDPEDIGYPIVWKNPNCPLVVYLTYYDEFGGICPITITRHWTFRNGDGNEETCTQTIYITDTQAPVLSCMPSEVTVYCHSIPVAEKCMATDNCAMDVAVGMSEESGNGDCESGYTMTRTYSAMNACGNTATTTQLIHVIGEGEANKMNPPATMDAVIIDKVLVSPNPFRPESTISFTSKAQGRATVIVVDLLGHDIATPFDSEVEKDARMAAEFKPASTSGGLFFLRIILNGKAVTGKIMYRPFVFGHEVISRFPRHGNDSAR